MTGKQLCGGNFATMKANEPVHPIHPLTAKRRAFLKSLGGLGAGVAALPSLAAPAPAPPPAPARPAGARYLGGFAAPKLDKVRCAFIGVGARGSGHCSQVAAIEGTDVVAVCDLYEDRATNAVQAAARAGHSPKAYFGDDKQWQTMLLEARPDAVFIATPWELHAPQSVGAMKCGAHAFVEVPAGITLEELWQIVDTAEATGRHCMMMENVNYGREELLFLNMVRQGVIGELLHAEAAYIHELRGQMMEVQRGTGSWRTYHYARRNGNLYPTHGLGPVAQYMNLARGEDNFRRLVSFSTPAKGRALFAKAKFPPDHQWNRLEYQGGDLNTSLIKTVLGRTVLVQWDETSPRPYSRLNLIQGTKGTLAGFPNRMAVEGLTNSYHEWTEGAEFQKIAEQYDHPLYKRMGELSAKMGGHGGMDFLMLFRIIECLRTGAPLDQNVYEGCYWSAVGPLSEKSVAEDGMPQDFPDFTRGGWKDTRPLGIVA